MLNIYSESVKEQTLDSVFDALMSISETDLDFIGENGVEYLWEDATEFESNREYVFNEIRNMENMTLTRAIETFFYMWLRYDNFYQEYDYDIAKDENENIVAISLAFITD